MSSKFVLAREDPQNKIKLPGRPVALVTSDRKELNGLFLCTVTYGVNGDEDGSSSESDEEEDESDPKVLVRRAKLALLQDKKRGDSAMKGSALHKSKMDVKADVDATMKKMPAAASAAAMYEKTTGKRSRKDKSGDDEEGEGGDLAPPAHGKRNAQTGLNAHKGQKHKKIGRAGTPSEVIRLPIGAHFTLLPPSDPDWRFVEYICGKSGSGKSMSVASIVRLFCALYPDRPVYAVCSTEVKEDPAYEGLPIKQLSVDFFNPGSFKVKPAFGDEGTLIIFDDWDSMETDALRTIQHAIHEILTLGRKLRISCIVTSHLLTNYNQTREIIHEADFITIFPQSAQKGSLKYFCDKLGIEKDDYRDLKRCGRWVTIHNHGPTFILTETEARMT